MIMFIILYMLILFDYKMCPLSNIIYSGYIIRLARERERLPEEHKRLLEEQITRNKTLEGVLIDKEGALRAEESRRLLVLEITNKEAIDDIARKRLRAETDLSEERAVLRDQKMGLQQERQRLEAHVSKEKNTLAALAIELSQREASIQMEINTLQRVKGEFEASKELVEPMLRATAAVRYRIKITE